MLANQPTGDVEFATYWRDMVGQDYADQRYYNSNAGRFYTPDPSGTATVDMTNPTSWNMYAYADADPINFNDPTGLFASGSNCPEGRDCQELPVRPPGVCSQPGVVCGPGSRPPRGGGGPPPPPPCNPTRSPSTNNVISFIVLNYQAAATVASEADQDFQGLNLNAADILGWAAAETGYATPASSAAIGLRAGNLDYFNLTAGNNWVTQVGCPPGANGSYACFGSFQGAAEAALFSPTLYGSYNGSSNVSAGYILGQVLGSGASLATAFQTMNDLLHFDPGNQNYGTGVQGAINAINNLLPCVQQYYAF
jgi:RHS repeat-associated protein